MAKAKKKHDPIKPRQWCRIVELEGFQILLTAEYDQEDDQYKLGVATYCAFGEAKQRFADFNQGTPEKDLAHIECCIKNDKSALKAAKGLLATICSLVGDGEDQIEMVHDDDLAEGEKHDPIRSIRLIAAGNNETIDGVVEE